MFICSTMEGGFKRIKNETHKVKKEREGRKMKKQKEKEKEKEKGQLDCNQAWSYVMDSPFPPPFVISFSSYTLPFYFNYYFTLFSLSFCFFFLYDLKKEN